MSTNDPLTADSTAPLPDISMWGIFSRAWGLYMKHFWSVTGALFTPVLLISAGGYGCLALNYKFMDYIVENHSAWLVDSPWQVFGPVAAITIGTMMLFVWGFWRYLLYYASLNINAAEAIEGRPMNFRDAYRAVAKQSWAYSILLITYGVLMLATMLPYIASLLAGAATEDANARIILLLSGVATSALLWLVAFVVMIFLTLVFQITAFEKLPVNPLITFRRSAAMVSKRLGTTVGLQVILMIVTGVAPIPVLGVLELIGLTRPLDALNQWIINYLVGSPPTTLTPEQLQVMSIINQHQEALAQAISQMVLSTILIALMLPLGTFAFTLLYREVAALLPQASSVSDPAPETPSPAPSGDI